MSNRKRLIRLSFNEVCLARDNHKCVMCGVEDVPLDVHHVVNRNDMPKGGYVKENGISLCDECHIKAEDTYFARVVHEDFLVDKLYEKIGSSLNEAILASVNSQV